MTRNFVVKGVNSNRHLYLRCTYCGGRKRGDKLKAHINSCMRKSRIQGKPKAPELLRDDESRREDESHECSSQFADYELSSINTSEIEQVLEESKEPSQDVVLGKRLASSSSQQLQAKVGYKPPVPI